MQTVKTESVQETEAFAANLAQTLQPPCVVCLTGDLGAGKTAFARGFARGCGVERGVSSPTFTLMHQYSGTVMLHHFDLYRLGSFDELLDIGFDETIESGVSLVEWADLFADEMPPDAIWVRILRGDLPDQRVIEVTP